MLKKTVTSSIGALMLVSTAIGLSTAAEQANDDKPHAAPPECLLSFPPELKVDSVFIYPTTIGIRPTAKLKIGTPALFSFSNITGDAPYSHKVKATLRDGDPAFWIDFPKDVPARVAVKLTLPK